MHRLYLIHPQLVVIGEYINNSTNIELYCKEHDCYYSTTPSSSLKRYTCCPKSNQTYKEEKVCTLLESWGYKITRGKTFNECRDINPLPFDCYLDDYNVCIEYDGEQHFMPVRFGTQSFESAKEKFEYTKRHDELKNLFCSSKNIPLIRIPYYEFDDLEFYLFDSLCKLHIIEETKLIS